MRRGEAARLWDQAKPARPDRAAPARPVRQSRAPGLLPEPDRAGSSPKQRADEKRCAESTKTQQKKPGPRTYRACPAPPGPQARRYSADGPPPPTAALRNAPSGAEPPTRQPIRARERAVSLRELARGRSSRVPNTLEGARAHTARKPWGGTTWLRTISQ